MRHIGGLCQLIGMWVGLNKLSSNVKAEVHIFFLAVLIVSSVLPFVCLH